MDTVARGCRFIDLTGQTFGRLTVVSFSGISKSKRASWICQCVCGNSKTVEGKSLRNGTTKSCGCLWIESISLSEGEASFNHHFLDYKIGAKKRNLSFLLEKEEFRKISSMPCYYCDAPPRALGSRTSNGRFVGNGLDRVNNDEGYSNKNVVSCCKQCNIAKSTMTQKEFLTLISNIFNNRIIGGKQNV